MSNDHDSEHRNEPKATSVLFRKERERERREAGIPDPPRPRMDERKKAQAKRQAALRRRMAKERKARTDE
jgi:hypothetical protein